MIKKGKLWYTDFTFRGKRIRQSTGLKDERAANEWEKRYIQHLRGEQTAKQVMETIRIALVEKCTQTNGLLRSL